MTSGVADGAAATMAAMSLTIADLARLCGGTLARCHDAAASVAAVEVDSRKVAPGAAFVALRGEHEDGHRYLDDAVRRGATCVVVGRGRPEVGALPPGVAVVEVEDPNCALRGACTRRLEELGCTVVGITGSVGKTTAKEMTAAALSRMVVARTPGNLNTWTGIPQTVLGLEPPVEVFVAEMAMSAPGELRDLARMTRPAIGVLLNVGLAHVGLLGSIEAIAHAKGELLEELPEDGLAVCNADDPWVRRMASRSRASSIVWFGVHSEDAAYRALAVEEGGLAGVRFLLRGPDGEAPTRLRFCGAHAALDACAAAAVAGRWGIGVGEVAERLADLEPPEHRGVIREGRNGAIVYDDCYNSSPTSLAAALEVLGHSGRRRRVAVIGDMLELGRAAEEAHREAGRRCASVATHVVAVGEHALLVVAAAREAGLDARNTVVCGDAETAAEVALSWCDGDTAILVKGSRALGLERVVERLRP